MSYLAGPNFDGNFVALELDKMCKIIASLFICESCLSKVFRKCKREVDDGEAEVMKLSC